MVFKMIQRAENSMGSKIVLLDLNPKVGKQKLKHQIYRKLKSLKTEGAQHSCNFQKLAEMTGNNRNTGNIQKMLNFLNAALLYNMLGVSLCTKGTKMPLYNPKCIHMQLTCISHLSHMHVIHSFHTPLTYSHSYIEACD